MIALFSFLPLVNADDNKVKVYIFEAGGCPYCEKEIEYLEGLDGYNKTFEVIRKELYIDHIDWESGKDYDLGVKVAKAFQEVGFADASYQGTPFIIVSDLYAKSAYNSSLESVINEAYEKGDKDIVGCIESGNDNCLDHLKTRDTATTSTYANNGSNHNMTILTVILCTAIVILVYVFKSNADKKEIIRALKGE